MKAFFICAQCGLVGEQETGSISRAHKKGAPLYCGRECSGLGRRKHKTKEQKIREKATYDAAYRRERVAMLKAKKAAWHKQTYDPVKAAEARKAKIPAHIEYCRRPEYREWKSGYDRKYRAKEQYGEYADAAFLVADIENEALSRATRYEMNLINGKLCKSQKRRRVYESLISD